MGSGINFKQLARTKFTRDDYGGDSGFGLSLEETRNRFGSPIKTSHRSNFDVLVVIPPISLILYSTIPCGILINLIRKALSYLKANLLRYDHLDSARNDHCDSTIKFNYAFLPVITRVRQRQAQFGTRILSGLTTSNRLHSKLVAKFSGVTDLRCTSATKSRDRFCPEIALRIGLRSLLGTEDHLNATSRGFQGVTAQ